MTPTKMSGADFYAYVLRVFKRTDKSTEAYEAITDVIMQIKLKYLFEDYKEESYTSGISTLGDYKISLPSDFGHLIGNVNLIDDTGNSRILNKRSKETFDRMYPDREAADVQRALPSDFCIFSGQIILGAIPDSTDYKYQINYTTEEAETITADTTAVPFTDRYRWTIRQLVLAELYFGLGFDDEGAKWKQLGEAGIQEMIANDEFNTGATDTVEYQGV
jgi:hypothetical protein